MSCDSQHFTNCSITKEYTLQGQDKHVKFENVFSFLVSVFSDYAPCLLC